MLDEYIDDGITVREGVLGDLTWIAQLIVKGSKERHFKPTTANVAIPLINSLISTGGVTIRKARYGNVWNEHVRGHIWVAELSGKPVSFLITLENDNSYELHLAYTVQTMRRKGGFTHLIRHCLNQAPMGKRVFARCYKKSTYAIMKLRTLGFTWAGGSDPLELELVVPCIGGLSESDENLPETAVESITFSEPRPKRRRLGLRQFLAWFRRT